MSAAAGSVEEWSGKDRGDENFPVGSLLIRARLRPHMHAFYAYARNADDIADSPVLAPGDKVARLDIMEEVLLGRREAGSPSAAALRASLAQTGVTAQHALDLLVAFRRDATKQRYATWEELVDYCRYSANPVGRHVLDLHGESRDIWPASDALCTVLQVLNHLQDGSKDLAALDRCYLPEDLMQRCGTSIETLRGTAETPGMRRVLNTLLDECEHRIRVATGLPGGTRDMRLRLETAVIVGLARRLARRLRHGDPIATRIKLTKTDAVRSVLAAFAYLPRPKP